MALAANSQVDRKDGGLVAHKVGTAKHIFQGALVKQNAAGFLAPCAAEAGAVFAGVAYEEVNNTGADGALSARVYKDGLFLLTGAGLAQADVGSDVYATHDALITTTFAANLQKVGKIVEFVSATQVWVQIETHSLMAAAIADPAGPGAGYVQAEVVAINDALKGVLAVLRAKRFIES